jgi:hypothetical protein
MKSLAIAALAAGGLIIAAPAVANADSQVEGSYATVEACEADGAGGQFTGPGADGTSFYCNQGDDGLFYLFITD